MSGPHTLKANLKNRWDYLLCRINKQEYPLKTVSDRTAIQNHEFAIPPICYQTWETNQFGRTHAGEIEKFRNLNPGVSWVLFDASKLDEYMRINWKEHSIYDIYARSKFGAMRADIFRYCILFERGGYYFDISKGCNTPLQHLHSSNSEALITFEKNYRIELFDSGSNYGLLYPKNLVAQWGFGFVKEHPFLRGVINRIVETSTEYEGRRFKDPKAAIWELTGPQAFTSAIQCSATSKLFGLVEQAGIDFNGQGVFNLPGSYVRYFTKRSYTSYRDVKILKSKMA
jgi:mannosyltransferase OCH1-like enzyme